MAANQQFYEIYRGTSIGMALADTLNELIASQYIDIKLAVRVMLNFDKSVATVLNENLKATMKVKGSVDTYNNQDEVWKWILKDAHFKMDTKSEPHSEIHSKKIKVVTCPAKQRPSR